jgi:hypothetical protein
VAVAHVYRIHAVGRDGQRIVLGTADTAMQALIRMRDAIGEYPRTWITDENDLDVSPSDLLRLAEEEDE